MDESVIGFGPLELIKSTLNKLRQTATCPKLFSDRRSLFPAEMDSSVIGSSY